MFYKNDRKICMLFLNLEGLKVKIQSCSSIFYLSEWDLHSGSIIADIFYINLLLLNYFYKFKVNHHFAHQTFFSMLGI